MSSRWPSECAQFALVTCAENKSTRVTEGWHEDQVIEADNQGQVSLGVDALHAYWPTVRFPVTDHVVAVQLHRLPLAMDEAISV